MNDTPQDAWFYTREGETLGPVTLSDLRVKVQEATLHPRLDMVWTQGMDDWKPAGEIEGLFERRVASAPQSSLGQSSGPYTPPKSEPSEEKAEREIEWPGARRRSFLIMTILFPTLWNLGFSRGTGFLGRQFGPEILNYIVGAGLILPVVVAVYFGLMRLVNLGMSRWWYLANFVPLLNLWIGYRTFACPAGYAYYKKLDAAGWVLAILYWLLVVIGILVMVAIIALLLGGIGNPELQGQVREAIRAVSERAAKP